LFFILINKGIGIQNLKEHNTYKSKQGVNYKLTP